MKNGICKEKILESLKGGLIVSCQARNGWPMYGREIMAAFAKAAQEGGAKGIRANWPENVREIKQKVDLPLIGINKIWSEEFDVYITPTYNSAVAVIEAGGDIVAIDGTERLRPDNEHLSEIIKKLKQNFPQILVMADIATLDEGITAAGYGADIIATTLAGYTDYTKHINGIDFQLIRQLSAAVDLPVIAEGRIHTPAEAAQAIRSGAYAVVVGTAITRPEVITRWFSEKVAEAAEL